MIREAQVFALALQFLTRLPLPVTVPYDPEREQAAARYYPLVGVLVGGIGAGVLALGALWLPMSVAACLAVLACVLVTGALHEDGLADMADGLGGGATRARALEIMRDSAIGSYGVLALVGALGLKVVLLASMPPFAACLSLVCAHGISRYACVWAIHTQSYARTDTAKFTAPHVGRAGHGVALLTAAALGGALGLVFGAGAGLALGLAALLAWITSRLYLRRLGGYTGDCLGALQQVSEIGVLLGVVAWL